MSLDVYLTLDGADVDCECAKCGHKHKRRVTTCVYDRNITHNLGEMARRAGIYEALWLPEERGIFRAEQLIRPLTEGLELLQAAPAYFKKFNPENGWGNYEGLLNFVTEYLKACKEHPGATIHANR